MSLEDLTGAKYINALVATNPVGGSDTVDQGDDHLRGIKNVLKQTFPNLDGPVTPTPAELNSLAGRQSFVNTFLQAADVQAAKNAIAADFPSGTVMVFRQTAAPTGWTKNITDNGFALRIVSGAVGSGGADDFTTVFGTGKSTASHALTTGQVPTLSGSANANSAFQLTTPIADQDTGGGTTAYLFSGVTITEGANVLASDIHQVATNAGGAHTHTVTVNSGGGGSHSHGINNMDLKYKDVIEATKD